MVGTFGFALRASLGLDSGPFGWERQALSPLEQPECLAGLSATGGTLSGGRGTDSAYGSSLTAVDRNENKMPRIL